MKTKDDKTRRCVLPLVAVVPLFLVFLFCSSNKNFAVLDGIKMANAISPCPVDNVVNLQYQKGGIIVLNGYTPVPPDRHIVDVNIHFYKWKKGQIEVLEATATPNGEIAVYHNMKPGQKYLLIRWNENEPISLK